MARDGTAQDAGVVGDIEEFAQSQQQARAYQRVPPGHGVQRRLRRLDGAAELVQRLGVPDRVLGAEGAGVDPGTQALDGGRDVGGRRRGRAQPKGVEAVDDGGEHRQQRQHADPQRLDVAQHVAGVGAVVGQVGRQHVDLGRIAGEPDQLPAAPLARRSPGQRVEAQPGRVAEPGVGPLGHDRAHRAREHQARDEARAEDADRDLLDPGQRRVEDRAGIEHRRKADQCRRIAGQHERVGARRAIKERQVKAGGDPQRHGAHEKDRRVHEGRHQGDGRRGTDDGADHPIGGFRARGPGERLRADVDGRHRPVGAGQRHGEGDVDRGHRGRERLDREEPVAARRQHQRGSVHGVRAPPRRSRRIEVVSGQAARRAATVIPSALRASSPFGKGHGPGQSRGQR